MTDASDPSRRRAWIGWLIALVGAFLLFCLGWVAIRGIGAGISLASAASGARTLQTMVADGRGAELKVTAKRLEADVANARTLTGDPIWRAAELVPWAGGNLTAVRQISEVSDDIARKAMSPLLSAAQNADLGTLGISKGQVDLEPLAAVASDLQAAADVLEDADRDVNRIDASTAIPPLADAVRELATQIDKISRATSMLSGAARLLPTMLGGDEPRTYLLLMQNNAELRSSGGNPGAFALLHARNGRLTLGTQASTTDFRTFARPVAKLSGPITTLFGDDPARLVQNTLNAPDFPTGARLAATMWTKTKGGHLDGVIAVDAVVMTYLLEATGPLTVKGVELDRENATGILLGEVYAKFDPAGSDAFFTSVAASVFRALTDGSTESGAILAALGEAGDSSRVRVWSADEQEQAIILDTSLSGVLPHDDGDGTHVGVLVNDTTGAKMDFFTDAKVDTRIGACGPDGRTRLRVTVDWSTTAPADAATSLPAYVTGDGWRGVPAGTTATRIAVVGPEGWAATEHGVDDPESVRATAETQLDGRPVVQYEVWMPPQSARKVTVEFTAPDDAEPFIDVSTTPMIRPTPVTQGELVCD